MAIDQSGILSLARQRIGNLRELKAGSNEWHGACPVCSSDDDGFMCWPESGNYWCRSCGVTGFSTQFIMMTQGKSWGEARAILGLDTSSNGKHPVSNSEIAYKSRDHYAAGAGLPESVFIKAKFSEIETYQNRPAMKYPTYDSAGNIHYRVRFMDGKSPKYKPIGVDVPIVWYRLQQALGMSNKTQQPLIIVNGEVSTLAAQHYGIPAICRTGGEMKLTDDLIAELQIAYKNSRPREILIALDCDDAGRKTAKAIETQLKDGKWIPTIIDLGFSDKGDFNDFTLLYTNDSSKRLQSLLSASKPISYNVKDAGKELESAIVNKVAPQGRILMLPFKPLHSLGGNAKFMKAKELTMIGSTSGHFKTSFWETMVDDFLPRGLSGICDAQEFGSQTYRLRRILRFSGRTIKGLDKKDDVFLTSVSYDEITEYGMHLQEIENNVPTFMRQAKNPFAGATAKAKLDTIDYIDNMIQQWVGHLEYVPEGMMFIEDRIVFMTNWVQERRASGKSVEFAIFDYVQLMMSRTNPKGINPYQWIVNLMKRFAIDNNLHVIVISQVNKQPSKDMKATNRRMGVGDLAWINDNDANLTIILNFYYVPQTDSDGEKVTDWNDDDIIERKILRPSGYTAAVVDVLKNSHGKPAPIRMPVDAKHLRWIDSTWG